MKILIVGGGNMGLTYAKAFINSHVVTRSQLMILEKTLSKTDDLKSLNIGEIYSDSTYCISNADLIILAVKPQDFPQLMESIVKDVRPNQIFLSIMAGVKMSTVCQGLNISKVIRAMPNLPAQIGQGMTAFTATDAVSRHEQAMVQNLLSTTGKTLYVEKEEMIDAVTAVSGSGPAYIYYFMDAMVKAAMQMGFPKSEAELLVMQTFSGAISLYQQSELSCDEWIQRVASKGGTTEAAIASFSQNEVSNLIGDGLHKALDRAVELGKS